jgi:hypothetical protein
MHVRDALDRLDQIHDHLTRSEVYRGFRVPAVASVGVLALAAAALQPLAPGVGFVWYWVVVAGVGALIGTAAAVHAYAYREDDFARRRTRRVMAQFLPCLVAGGAVTVALARAGPEFVALLPGLWAVLFGLGVVAARPHLPSAIWLVGLGYAAVGVVLLLRASATADPTPWSVGGVFGIGHLATAAILWREVEGESDE